MTKKNAHLLSVLALALVFSGCATSNLNRIDLTELEQIGARLYGGSGTTNVMVPDEEYRVGTVFRIVGDDEDREDDLSRGVSVRGTAVRSRVTNEGLFINLPIATALQGPEVTVDFYRVFEDRESSETVEWSVTYEVRWPTARQWDFDGQAGQDGADVTVELAYYDAEGIPNAPGNRMVIAQVYRAGGGRGTLYLFSESARLNVTARGGGGRKGSTGNNPVLLGSSYNSRPVTRDYFAGGEGGRGGDGGSGGEVNVVTPFGFRELQDRVTVNANGGAGGAGGDGGFNARLTVTRVEGPNGTSELWRYARDGRARSGAPGIPGEGGVWIKRDMSIDELFTTVPSNATWFDRDRLIQPENVE